MLIPDVWNADVFHWKNSIDFSTFWCFFTVQFCGKNPGAPGLDSQTTGGRDGLQDHGARQKLHERQEEGKTFFIFIFLFLLYNNNSIHFLLLLFKLYPLYLIFNFCSGFPLAFFFLAFVVCLYVWTKWCGIPLFFFNHFTIEGLVGHVFIAFFFFFCEVDHILPLRQHITNRRQMERDKIQALPF